MSFESSSSEQSDFNFTHSPTGPLSLEESRESDNCLNFSPFNYLPSSNAASDPTLHEEDQIFLGHGDELIPIPLDEDMLIKVYPLTQKARFLPACTLDVLLDKDRRTNLILMTHSGSLLTNQNTLQNRR